MLVDSHCHLDFSEFKEDFQDILRRAESAGVGIMQTICTRFTTFPQIIQTANKSEKLYCSVGLHPNYLAEEGVFSAEQISALCEHDKVIGIGETGLDYYYDYSPKGQQRESFIEHIKAAQMTGLPLIIHTRDADEDTVNILKEYYKEKPFKILIHCFTASKWLADECLKLGAYISASGIVTFKKSTDIQNTFKDVPLDRILVETDAPYLAPVPYRGKRNEPAYVKHTAEFLAEIKGVSFDEVAKVTTANFFELFDKVKK